MYFISNIIESINFIVIHLSYYMLCLKKNHISSMKSHNINVNIKSRIKENIFYYHTVLEDNICNDTLYQNMNNIIENIH